MVIEEIYECDEEKKKNEIMLKRDSVQAQFAGYYYDGKIKGETSRKLEKMMIGECN